MAKKRPPSTPEPLAHIAEQLRPLAVPLADLRMDPRNARTHSGENLAAIAASLREFGQLKPVVAHRQTQILEAGNGTYLAAQSLGWTHLAVVWVEHDPAAAAGFAIADNRTAELAGWDDARLAELLVEIEQASPDLYADLLLDQLRGDAPPSPAPGQCDPDDVPEPPAEPVTKPGDLWTVGAHRLLCGDSTKPQDVARVMGGERADLCFTSPPYAQQRDYTKESKQKVADWDGLMRGVFGNLPMADAGQVLVNLGLIHRDGEWVPYWDGWIAWMRQQGWRRFGWYVWDKGHAGWKDGNRLTTEHEFVWHFCKEEIAPVKCFPCKTAGKITNAPRTYMKTCGPDKSRIVQYENGDVKIGGSVCRVYRCPEKGISHPAAFPVGLPAYYLPHWPGLIYEPFLGSGTTVIAAEQLGRKCYGIEISPQYCDVIVARWEKFTGRKASRKPPPRLRVSA